MRWLWLFVLASLLTPTSAFAWTNARVRSARASVAIDPQAHAHVTLDVTLRVDGGWLEGFELDGLDPDLVLDPNDPVTLVRIAPPDEPLTETFASEAFAPRVEVHTGGQIALALARRGAPRRGDYLVHVAYDTVLAGRATTTAADGVTVRWTFPAWRYGLDSVEVDILAPPGATALETTDEEIGMERIAEPDGARIVLTRAHLARTREWPIEIVIPLAAMDPSLTIVPEVAPPTALVSPTVPERPWHGAIALLIAGVLVALRTARAPWRTLAERSEEHPLVPLSSAWRARAILLLAVALAVLDRIASVPGLAIAAVVVVVLTASRARPTAALPKLGSFRHATPTLFRAARRAALLRSLGIDAWLDATTPAGALLLASLSALAIALVPEACLGSLWVALALVVYALLVDPHAARPEPALVTLDRLTRFVGALRVSLDAPAVAFLPVVHLGVGGEAHEARLRVVGPLAAEVLRTDLVVVGRGPFGARYGLLVVVRRGGPAAAALTTTAFRVIAVGSERIARLVPIRRANIGEAWLALSVALEPAAGVALRAAA